jgi:hypothetical protein
MKLIKLTSCLVLVLALSGCKFFQEKGWFGGKKADTMEAYMMRMDSIDRADSMQMVQTIRQREIDDSLEQVRQQELARQQAKKFVVILGSFKVPSNADNYLGVVRGMGYDAEIITAPRGWNLVCAVAFEKKRDAFRKAREFQNTGQDAWVYVRE